MDSCEGRRVRFRRPLGGPVEGDRQNGALYQFLANASQGGGTHRRAFIGNCRDCPSPAFGPALAASTIGNNPPGGSRRGSESGASIRRKTPAKTDPEPIDGCNIWLFNGLEYRGDIRGPAAGFE
jgi:hypothetical protein